MTAHDVRNLTICHRCRKPVSKIEGIKVVWVHNAQNRDVFYHGACAVDDLGRVELLALPWAERRKFSLNDTGPDLMRALIDKGTS